MFVFSKEIMASGNRGFESKPGIPGTPVIVDHDSTKVELKWTAPTDDGGSPVLYYIITLMNPLRGSIWCEVLKTEDNKCQCVIGNLKPGSCLRFRVKAVNKVDVGEPSNPTNYHFVSAENDSNIEGKNAVGIVEEFKQLWSKKLFCDAVFTVKSDMGDECTYNAHKLVVSLWSSVLADMIHDNNTDNIKIQVQDSLAFGFLLSYMYGVDSGFTDFKLPVNVYKLAKQYEMEDLMNKIKNHFSNVEVTPDDFVDLWNAAKLMKLEYLRHKCLNVLETQTAHVLKSNDIQRAPLHVMKTLLSMKNVSLHTEYELIKLVFEWGRNRYTTVVPSSSIRDVLQTPLSYLKFSTLTCNQFAELIENYASVFEEDEAFSIFMNLSFPGSYPLPIWVNSKVVNRTFLNKKLSRNNV